MTQPPGMMPTALSTPSPSGDHSVPFPSHLNLVHGFHERFSVFNLIKKVDILCIFINLISKHCHGIRVMNVDHWLVPITPVPCDTPTTYDVIIAAWTPPGVHLMAEGCTSPSVTNPYLWQNSFNPSSYTHHPSSLSTVLAFWPTAVGFYPFHSID